MVQIEVNQNGETNSLPLPPLKNAELDNFMVNTWKRFKGKEGNKQCK